MAMYYYASKLSAIACGTRCRQSDNKKNRSRISRSYYRKTNEDTADDDNKDKKMTKHDMISTEEDIISGRSSEPPEFCCEDAPIDFCNTVLGSGGIMYFNGSIISGPEDSLVDLLLPPKQEDLDQEFIFSFLLSSRLFIKPHELLQKLIAAEQDTLDRLVGLLSIWTKTFPYDFRDERIMSHVKHIVTKCADTKISDIVSELLCALLKRLTDLEQHEDELKACQISLNETESFQWPCASQLAQILCRIERVLAKHVGPEEFIQCGSNVLRDPKKAHDEEPTPLSGTLGSQDPKKTCNLESYISWSTRLKLIVANEIIRCEDVNKRKLKLELWSGVAQYCLLVGNYNSATAILESLDSPPIARLHATWSNLSSTTNQQLDSMQRHAEGCGNLWSKQTEGNYSINNNNNNNKNSIRDKTTTTLAITTPTTSTAKVGTNKTKSTDWVVIPVFVDIVKLALKAREDCCIRLPNGHINVAAFDRLAAVVGAFTKHMCEVNTKLPEISGYENLCRYIQSCSLLNESELMLGSFDCEEPTKAEKELYDIV